MDRTRERRIIKWVLLAVLAVPLILTGYLTAFGLVTWNYGREAVELPPALNWDGPLFVPIVLYMNSDLPGASTLYAFSYWCLHKGFRWPTSWEFEKWSAEWERRGSPPPGPMPPIYDEQGRRFTFGQPRDGNSK